LKSNNAPNSVRRCNMCSARLSSYNDDTLCYACQKKKPDFPGIANYERTTKVVYGGLDLQRWQHSLIQSRKPFVP